MNVKLRAILISICDFLKNFKNETKKASTTIIIHADKIEVNVYQKNK